jgi:hypothetical protein
MEKESKEENRASLPASPQLRLLQKRMQSCLRRQAAVSPCVLLLPSQERKLIFETHPLLLNWRSQIEAFSGNMTDPLLTETRPQGIFGVPLRQSITYANVAISLVDDDGKSYIYGYVPIVVAKCGVFLKEKGALDPRYSNSQRL